MFNTTEPLGLPPGSIRAIITLVLLGSTIAFYGIWQWAPPELVGMSTLAVGFYIGTRQGATSAG